MSFGLLTAVNIEDVPKILRRVSTGYRGTETTHNLHIWHMISDELDKFAMELEAKIETAKKQRVRL
jgi:hypothetical protein